MTESKIDEVLNVPEEEKDKQGVIMADNEMIFAIASRILEEYQAAFLELAK